MDSIAPDTQPELFKERMKPRYPRPFCKLGARFPPPLPETRFSTAFARVVRTRIAEPRALARFSTIWIFPRVENRAPAPLPRFHT